MSGAPILAPEAKRSEDWAYSSSLSGNVPVWDQESCPRLHKGDLDDPESFHRRLVDWLMNQK